MLLLVVVSLIWGFSPILIQVHLGGLDSTACAITRLVLALPVFVPLLRPRALAARHVLSLAVIGGIQFGLMYACYMAAFRWLRAEEVFLFTVGTPLFVALVHAVLERRAPPIRWGVAVLLAIASSIIVLWREGGQGVPWVGFFFVQGANLCFAFGQIAYKRLRPRLPENVSDAALFGWLILGGSGFAFACSFWPGAAVDWAAFFHTAALSQWVVLGILGVVASGVCFFLWNRGALQVSAGRLAVFNNLKIPLGVVCSLAYAVVFRNEFPSLERLGCLGVSLALMFGALSLVAPRAADNAPATSGSGAQKDNF